MSVPGAPETKSKGDKKQLYLAQHSHFTCFSLIDNHLSIGQGNKHFVVKIPVGSKERRGMSNYNVQVKHTRKEIILIIYIVFFTKAET